MTQKRNLRRKSKKEEDGVRTLQSRWKPMSPMQDALPETHTGKLSETQSATRDMPRDDDDEP